MNGKIMTKEDDKFGRTLSDIIAFKEQLDAELARIANPTKEAQQQVEGPTAVTGSVKDKAGAFEAGGVSNTEPTVKKIPIALSVIRDLPGSGMIKDLLAPLQVKTEQGHDAMKAKLQGHLIKGEVEEALSMLMDIHITEKLFELEGDSLFKKNATPEQKTKIYNAHKDQLQSQLDTFKKGLSEVIANKDKPEAKKGIMHKLTDMLQVMFDKLKINIQISRMSGKEKLTKSLKQMSVATGAIIKTSQSKVPEAKGRGGTHLH